MQWLRLLSTYYRLLHRLTQLVHKTHILYLQRCGCISRAHFVGACTDQVTTNSPSASDDEDENDYDTL